MSESGYYYNKDRQQAEPCSPESVTPGERAAMARAYRDAAAKCRARRDTEMAAANTAEGVHEKTRCETRASVAADLAAVFDMCAKNIADGVESALV